MTQATAKRLNEAEQLSNHPDPCAEGVGAIASDERLHRLAVEAAGYLGLEVGDSLPVEELVAQGVANGYTEQKVRGWLRAEGLTDESEVCVPPRNSVLGELWEPTAPPLSGQTLEAFRDWCEDKRQMRREEYDDGTYQHPVEHAYSYKAERQKFARFKDVERYFKEEYPTFTTILVTYTRPRSEDETIVEHAEGFYSDYITRKRRECIKATGQYDEYAGVSLLAPKDVAPKPRAETTHGHDALVIPGFVSSECFAPLESMDGVDVSIRYHRSDKVRAPPAVNRHDLETERGATTALAQEVGANLPVLAAIEGFRDKVRQASTNSARYKAALDATDCPAYVERWCACMSCGEDGDPATNGVRRWRPLGRFSEIADLMKGRRDYGTEGVGAETESEDREPGSPSSNPLAMEETVSLTDTEREFVRQYLAEGLSTERDVIAANVSGNINELGGMARTEVLIEAIQEMSD